VLPEDADIDKRRVSVLAPIGAALIGLSVGQEIGWKVADGRIRQLIVLAVNQAPKATVGAARH
jgi:regulator of nucleoside diphosphate kinase